MAEPVRRDWCEEHNRGSLAVSNGLCPECQQRTIELLRNEIDGRAENDIATALANTELIAERDALKTLMKRRESFILGLLWDTTEKSDVAQKVGEEIIEIMQTYDHQMSVAGYVDTPGGLEHMGDVWLLLSKWRDRLIATKRLPNPKHPPEIKP